MGLELDIPSDFNSDVVVSEYFNCYWTNILIIGMCPFTKTFLEKYLSTINCNVYTSGTCFEGLAFYKSIPNAISILIVDLSLQELDGLTIYSIFKTLNPSIKIIFLVEPTMDISLLSNLEVNSILEKPITIKQLGKIIKLMA